MEIGAAKWCAPYYFRASLGIRRPRARATVRSADTRPVLNNDGDRCGQVVRSVLFPGLPRRTWTDDCTVPHG